MRLEATEELIAAVGRENALEGEAAAEYAVVGRAPRFALFPHTLEAACAAMAAAHARELAVAPFGGGTQIGLGAPPVRLDVALVTRNLNRIVDYQPDDMTVTVEAGVTMAGLQQTLAQRGQFLPLDPPLPRRATAGGTVAANLSGPWRAAFGTARDWLIGVRVVAPDGEIVKGGGRVVKNVAGYDLCKLYTGSLGTLGVMAELTFKVLPRPEASAVAAVPVSLSQIEPLLAAVMDSDLSPSGLELFAASGDVSGIAPLDGAALLTRFDGPKEAVEWQLSELAAAAAKQGISSTTVAPDAEALWENVRDWTAGPWAWIAMAGVLSSDVASLMEYAQRQAAEMGVALEAAARAATGTVFFGARGPLAPETARGLTERLRGEAVSIGGTLVVLDAAPPLREGLDPWGPLGAELRLIRGIKTQLDPKGIMNPGRFVGGI